MVRRYGLGTIVLVIAGFMASGFAMEAPIGAGQEESTEVFDSTTQYLITAGGSAMPVHMSLVPKEIAQLADDQGRINLRVKLPQKALRLWVKLLEQLNQMSNLPPEKRQEALDQFINTLPGLELEIDSLIALAQLWNLTQLKDLFERIKAKKYQMRTSDEITLEIPYLIARQLPWFERFASFEGQQPVSPLSAAAAAAAGGTQETREPLPSQQAGLIDYPAEVLRPLITLLIKFDEGWKKLQHNELRQSDFNRMMRAQIERVPDIDDHVLDVLNLVHQLLGVPDGTYAQVAHDMIINQLANYAMGHINLASDEEYTNFSTFLPPDIQLILLSHIQSVHNVVPALTLLARLNKENLASKENPTLKPLFDFTVKQMTDYIAQHIIPLLALHSDLHTLFDNPALAFMNESIKKSLNSGGILIHPGRLNNAIEQIVVLNENTIVFRTFAGLYVYFLNTHSWREINYEGTAAMARVSDNQLAIAIGWGDVYILDFKDVANGADPKEVKIIKTSFYHSLTQITQMIRVDDTTLIVSDGSSIEVIYVDSRSGGPIHSPSSNDHIQCMHIVGNDRVLFGTDIGGVYLLNWETARLQVLNKPAGESFEERQGIGAVSSIESNGSKLLIAAQEKGTIYFWNEQGVLIKELPISKPIRTLISFSPERIFAFGTYVEEKPGDVLVLNVEALGSPRIVDTMEFPDSVTAMAPYGDILFIIGTDGGGLYLRSLVRAYGSIDLLFARYRQMYANDINTELARLIELKKKSMTIKRALELLNAKPAV